MINVSGGFTFSEKGMNTVPLSLALHVNQSSPPGSEERNQYFQLFFIPEHSSMSYKHLYV